MKYLCDPVDGTGLILMDAIEDTKGDIVSGRLISNAGREYQIRRGIPRFSSFDQQNTAAVAAFGDEWNYFNFDEFRLNWIGHTVRNTFGSDEVFKDKIIVDAGAGSGMQSRWMAEAGAKLVISLELSHSVDDVMARNLKDVNNVQIVQCSIDSPPIRAASIDGLVICHNVIQHTTSVERTAEALWRLVAPGGELVFNCYAKREGSRLWMLRYRFYQLWRGVLSRRSFTTRLAYARTMSLLRFIPILGWMLEASLVMVRGHVPDGPNRIRRCYRAGVLNTFDWYGGHAYQHHKSEQELRALVRRLQPNENRVRNMDSYFSIPQPKGCAIRVTR